MRSRKTSGALATRRSRERAMNIRRRVSSLCDLSARHGTDGKCRRNVGNGEGSYGILRDLVEYIGVTRARKVQANSLYLADRCYWAARYACVHALATAELTADRMYNITTENCGVRYPLDLLRGAASPLNEVQLHLNVWRLVRLVSSQPASYDAERLHYE